MGSPSRPFSTILSTVRVELMISGPSSFQEDVTCVKHKTKGFGDQPRHRHTDAGAATGVDDPDAFCDGEGLLPALLAFRLDEDKNDGRRS